jgi:hypothetical protein
MQCSPRAKGCSAAGRFPATSPAALAGEVAREGLGVTRKRFVCLHVAGRGPAAAAGSSTPANRRPGLAKKRVWKLCGCKRKVGVARVGVASVRRAEFTMATPMADGGSLQGPRRAAANLTPFIVARALGRGSRYGARTVQGATANGSPGAARGRARGRARERRRSTAAQPLVGRRQGWCARPQNAGRVATTVWVRTSVRGLGTSGHRGVRAFVPGRSTAPPTRPSARDVERGRKPARFNFKWPCSNANFSKFSN